jgi:tRNA A-37 threonylcarbamoyl transferase component Bud32
MTFAQPFSEYEVLDRVGAGAMGTVFKARHKRLNRVVALKVLKPSLARDKRYVDRLKREARIVASLSHPNIVTGFDLGEEGGYHYFVMEFVEGKSLRALLSEWGQFAEDYTRRVARQVAQALDHAYQRGVIHRDIKPGNILIDDAGNVKLTDMGLAKGPADLTLTRDGATVGTPQYISPEQARNPHDVDVRTDLYSLGATLYHMVTGVPPFGGDTMAELITNVLNELPVSPKAINSRLSEGMSLVIRKLLAKDLRVRYQTPRDLLDDLDRLERSLPPQIDPQRLTAEEGSRPHWAPRAALAVGLAALLGGAWWLGVAMREHDGVPSPPTASEFVAALEERLAQLPTPGERLAHLGTLPPPPLGAESELQRRKKLAEGEVNDAIRSVASEFSGDAWLRLKEWLEDPAVWPDLQRTHRERFEPLLRARVGLPLGQLQPRLEPIERLQQAVQRTLDERDQALLVRFEVHVKSKLPALASERIAAADFVGAEKVWTDALPGFLDGVRRPLPERLSATTLTKLRARLHEANADGLRAIESEEASVAGAMRAEIDTVCASIAQQLAGDLSPDAAERLLVTVREDFERTWPAAARFRPARNPWHDVQRRLGETGAEVQAAAVRLQERRFEQRCDLAWRTFCHGRADDALAVLDQLDGPAPAQQERLERHRASLRAARAVERAVLAAIARSGAPIGAFLRGANAEAIYLRVRQQGDAWELLGNALQQEPRPVSLSQLRFSKLLDRLQQDGDPLASLAQPDRALGSVVYRLPSDELDGFERVLAALPDPERRFLLDDVWHRVLHVRAERPQAPLDRQRVFEQLRAARAEVDAGGPLGPLEQALERASNFVPLAERSPAEEEELRANGAFAKLMRRREVLLQDLRRTLPRDAEVDVRAAGAELSAEVGLPPPVLLGWARDWQLRGRTLEFAGSQRPWNELEQQKLEGPGGVEPGAARSVCAFDVVFPPPTVGRRFYVFEFRGIACVVVLGANDSVQVALVDGDVRREDAVQRAFLQALGGLASSPRALAVPGGVHRLTLDLQASASRAHATVRVLFDGVDLLAQPQRPRALGPVTFAVHPQQELAIARVVVRADGV